MNSDKPRVVAIDPDNHHANQIGVTSDGNQYFLTTPFEPAVNGSAGCEYIALFLFDSEGNLLDSIIEALGARESLDEVEAKEKYNKILSSLGSVSSQRIVVKPFSITHNATEIGLVAVAPEDEDDDWVVEMQPGNYMVFYEPWDSGEYDT